MQGMIWGEPELTMHCYGMYGGVELLASLSPADSAASWLVPTCSSLASLSSAESAASFSVVVAWLDMLVNHSSRCSAVSEAALV